MSEPELTVRKVSALIQVPYELLHDAPDIHGALFTRRGRQRMRRAALRRRLAERAYRLLAGYDVPPEPDPYEE